MSFIGIALPAGKRHFVQSNSLSPNTVFLITSPNVAVCPKTFSSRVDSHCQWHEGDTPSDIQSGTKKTGTFENPTKIEEIQGKKLLTN